MPCGPEIRKALRGARPPPPQNKRARQRDAQGPQILRLAQHGAAQLFLQAAEGLGPGARHARHRPAFTRAAGKVLHSRGVHFAPDARNILQRALVHGFQLCTLRSGGFLQKTVHFQHAFLKAVYRLCTLVECCARRAMLQLGPAAVCAARFWGGRGLPRGRLLLAALRGLGRRAPACRRFGLRPQRKLRLPGRCCTAAKGAAEQLINIVFHGASPFAAKAAGILCAGRCTGLYPVVRRPAPVLGLYYTTFSKPIYRLLARPR